MKNAYIFVGKKLAELTINRKMQPAGAFELGRIALGLWTSKPQDWKLNKTTSVLGRKPLVLPGIIDSLNKELSCNYTSPQYSALHEFGRRYLHDKSQGNQPIFDWVKTIDSKLDVSKLTVEAVKEDVEFISSIKRLKTFRDYFNYSEPFFEVVSSYADSCNQFAKRAKNNDWAPVSRQINEIRRNFEQELQRNPSITVLHKYLSQVGEIKVGQMQLKNKFDEAMENLTKNHEQYTPYVKPVFNFVKHAAAISNAAVSELVTLSNTLSALDSDQDTVSLDSGVSSHGSMGVGNHISDDSSSDASGSSDAGPAPSISQPATRELKHETMVTILQCLRTFGTIGDDDFKKVQDMLQSIPLVPKSGHDFVGFTRDFAKAMKGMDDNNIDNVSRLVCAYVNSTSATAPLSVRLGTRLSLLGNIKGDDISGLAKIYSSFINLQKPQGEDTRITTSDKVIEILYEIGKLDSDTRTACLNVVEDLSYSTFSAHSGEGAVESRNQSQVIKGLFTIAENFERNVRQDALPEMKAKVNSIIDKLCNMQFEYVGELHNDFLATPTWVFEVLKSEALGMPQTFVKSVKKAEQFKSVSREAINHIVSASRVVSDLIQDEVDAEGNTIVLTQEEQLFGMVDALHHLAQISDDDIARINNLFSLDEEDQPHLEPLGNQPVESEANEDPDLFPNMRRLKQLAHLAKEDADVTRLKQGIHNMVLRAKAAQSAVEIHTKEQNIRHALGDVWRNSKKVNICKDVLMGTSIVGAIVALAFPPSIVVVAPLILCALLAVLICFIIDLVPLKKTGEVLKANMNKLLDRPKDMAQVDHLLNIITAVAKPENAPENYRVAAENLKQVDLAAVQPIAQGLAGHVVEAAMEDPRP
ncbi:MAG: hypothetical protein VXW87_03260 [Pseudomonadota bacterium]|nr:hypothetical protein [Pseudomonadota bacterium]